MSMFFFVAFVSLVLSLQQGAGGRCVRLSEEAKSLVNGSLFSLCPLFAGTYTQASGVSVDLMTFRENKGDNGMMRKSSHMISKSREAITKVLDEPGDPEVKHDEAIELTNLLEYVGQGLEYLKKTKTDIVPLLMELQWNSASDEEITFKLEMMLCTSLLPLCTNRAPTYVTHAAAKPSQPTVVKTTASQTQVQSAKKSSTQVMKGKSLPSAATPKPRQPGDVRITAASQTLGQSVKNKTVTSTASLPPLPPSVKPVKSCLRVLRLCDWLCDDIKHVLPQVIKASARPDHLRGMSSYASVSRMQQACTGTDSAVPGQSVHCLNLTRTADAYVVVEQVYPYQANECGSASSHNYPSLPVRYDTLGTYRRSQSTCFNVSKRCAGAYVATPIERHWAAEVRLSLDKVVAVVAELLNADTSVSLNSTIRPCAAACKSHVFSDGELKEFSDFMLVTTQLTLVVIVFAVVSFLIQWERMSKYPMCVLLFLNVCALMAFLSYSLPFYLPGGSQALICHSDGSLLFNQPRAADESTWCITQFIVTYYFQLSMHTWWACFAHSWFTTFSRLEWQTTAAAKAAARTNRHIMLIYHLVAWTPGLVLLIPILTGQKIAGEPNYGICWFSDAETMLYYAVVPQAIILFIGSTFMGLGMRSLWRARRAVKQMWKSGNLVPSRKKKKDGAGRNQRYLVQMPVFICSCILSVSTQFALGVYEFNNARRWQQELQLRSICLELTCQDVSTCPPAPSGNIAYFLVKFLAGVIFSWLACSWAFLSPQTWIRWQQVVCTGKRWVIGRGAAWLTLHGSSQQSADTTLTSLSTGNRSFHSQATAKEQSFTTTTTAGNAGNLHEHSTDAVAEDS